MENAHDSSEFPAARDVPRFRPLAIVVGWLADTAFSFITGIVTGISAAVLLIRQGTPPDQVQDHLNNNLTWLLGLSVLGCCGTILGGYVAAWMGKAFPLRHGFAVGMLSILSSLLILVLSPRTQPLWFSVAGLALTVPAGLLGGYLWAVRAPRKVVP